MSEWSQAHYLQEIWRESVAARRNSAEALKEIERLDAKIEAAEAGLKRNADKAHATIGSNIAKLGDQVDSLGDQVVSIGDHLDKMDADLKTVKESVGHIYSVVDK